MFMRLPTKEAQEVIEQDQTTLTSKIDDTRKVIKDSLTELNRLEGNSAAKGFDLEGMTAQDLYSI
ncbi:unnamed protein product [Absidia cylindrospora]